MFLDFSVWFVFYVILLFIDIWVLLICINS